MISIPGALPRLTAAARILALCAGVLWLLSGCNTDYNLGATGYVGVSSNVTLTTSGNVTQIYVGNTLPMVATVANASSNQDVNWQVSGAGGLLCANGATNCLPTQCVAGGPCTQLTTPGCGAVGCTVTYLAPLSIIGATTGQVTAIEAASPTNTGEVTLVTFGSPVMNAGGSATNPGQLFPANVNLAYAAQVTVEGGTPPFTWNMGPGSTLPAGLVLNGSTSGVTTISGTPTAAGSYSFQVEASDTDGNVASEQLSLTVNAENTCVLSGTYTFTFSGFRGGSAATHIGNITIGGASSTPGEAVISGEQDYKDGHRTTVDETLLPTSNCQNISTNTGYLRLIAPSGEIDYVFAATPPDASGVIHAARLQLVSSGSDSGSGEMELTDASALTGAPPSGNFAFGLLGADSTNANYGTAGRFTSSSSGDLSAGVVDSNGGSASALGSGTSDAALSGALSAPDAKGRGTATLTVGSTSSTLAYYIVNANRMFLMNVTPTANTARESGFLTAQVGDVTGSNSFDNAALASSSIVSLWGNSGVVKPSTILALGRLANGNASAGTVDVTLDAATQSIPTVEALYSAQSYDVAANGRGTLTITSGGTSTPLVFYLDGTADGYVVQPGSSAGTAGLLEAQAAAPPGGYSPTLAGTFVGGTQYPMADGQPVSLLSLVYLDYGSLSSTYTTGTFYVDPITGRGFAQVSYSGIGALQEVMYVVSPTKVDLMNYGTITGIDGTMQWLVQ